MTAALAAAPTALADVVFEPTPVRDWAPTEEVVVENDSGGPLGLSSAAVSGPDAPRFTILDDECDDAPLPPGGLCAVRVGFAPQRLGTHTATLEIAVEGEQVPLAIPMSAESIPWLRVTPAALDFGTLPFGIMSSPQEVVVENISGRTMGQLITQVSPSRFRFSSNSCSLVRLAPGGACRVSITFSGGLGGAFEGRLFLGQGLNASMTGYNEVGSVSLRGTGLPRPPQVRPPEIATPDVSPHLQERLVAALTHLRVGGRVRPALLRRGLVVRGIVPPARGMLGLVVRTRASRGSPSRLVAVRRRLPVQAAGRSSIHAELTRAGRRMLRSGRRLVLDVTLTMVARRDKTVSSAQRVLRVPRVAGSRAP